MKPIFGTLTVAAAVLALALMLAGTAPPGPETNFDGSFAPPADVSGWGRP